jgi:hypothetical protein
LRHFFISQSESTSAGAVDALYCRYLSLTVNEPDLMSKKEDSSVVDKSMKAEMSKWYKSDVLDNGSVSNGWRQSIKKRYLLLVGCQRAEMDYVETDHVMVL